jgi:uncharacterized membrane protein
MSQDPKATAGVPDFESQPLTRGEYVQSVIHLYRGEMQRAVTWRSRLDATTNWAIVVTITALSYAFGAVEHPHVIIILANLVVLMLLWVEARRYRYYDVWRTRLRKIEENFFAPILRRDLLSPDARWGSIVADDFLRPRYKIAFRHALKMRLMRNYAALFGITLAAWLVKIAVWSPKGHLDVGLAFGWSRFYEAMAFSTMPPGVVLGIQAAFYGFLLWLVLFVHVPLGYSGEIHEITPDREFWDR